jgi:methionyl-tRNA synthetase
VIKRLLKTMNVNFSNYTRTENKVHYKFVRGFYKQIESNGFVYDKVLRLPYCEFDKRFLPDRFVEGECPYCHFAKARGDQCDNCSRVLDPTDLINPYCVICHRTPVFRESRHWFFDLPKLEGSLKEYIEGNKNFPENARNFSLSWLKEGLKPRSLTRDNRWGIPAPFKGAEGKTIYVWMEAVLGYVSATKEWAQKLGRTGLWRTFWLDSASRNVHFIGKDNIPFHTIVFPGLLIASRESYNLPWQVSSTEFFLFDGEKFSKSRGIGIWMHEALELESSEYWRYALMSLRPELKDTNFTWEEFERKVNTELNDVVGNFVHRTLSFIQTNFEGRVPEFDPNLEAPVIATIKLYREKVTKSLENFKLKEGLENVVDLAREGNRYFNGREPWRKIKADRHSAAQSLGTAVQFVAAIGDLIYPFLPETSKKITTSLGRPGIPDWSPKSSRLVKSGTRIRSMAPLYHKVSSKDLRDKLDKIRKRKPIETQN